MAVGKQSQKGEGETGQVGKEKGELGTADGVKGMGRGK
jgi:hypothetical protein